jgi:hypothetical protein
MEMHSQRPTAAGVIRIIIDGLYPTQAAALQTSSDNHPERLPRM